MTSVVVRERKLFLLKASDAISAFGRLSRPLLTTHGIALTAQPTKRQYGLRLQCQKGTKRGSATPQNGQFFPSPDANVKKVPNARLQGLDSAPKAFGGVL